MNSKEWNPNWDETPRYIAGIDAYDAERIEKGSLFLKDEVGHYYNVDNNMTFLDQISYKEIFSGGIDDESLELACIKAKRKVLNGIEYREIARIAIECYSSKGIIFQDQATEAYVNFDRITALGMAVMAQSKKNILNEKKISR